MHTVMATSSDFDSILLVDENDRVLSAWQADDQMVKTYLAIGSHAARWQTDVWPSEFNPNNYKTPEWAEELRSIYYYGEECGRNGQIADDSRRQFWRL